MDDSYIVWELNGLGKHAVTSRGTHFDFHAPLRTRLGDDRRAEIQVDMAEERKGVHSDGVMNHGTASVSATLDISKPPSAELMIRSFIYTELADNVIELMLEWAKKWSGPRVTTALAVSWHEKKYILDIRGEIDHDFQIIAREGTSTTNSRLIAKASIPLRYDAQTAKYKGESPFFYTGDVSISWSPATVTCSSVNLTDIQGPGELSVEMEIPSGELDHTSGVTLTYNPHRVFGSVEFGVSSCVSQEGGPFDMPWHLYSWSTAHLLTHSYAIVYYTITTWSYPGTEILATTQEDKTWKDGGLRLKTTFELKMVDTAK